MKIKVITPPPVVPSPTIEVTLNEAEARFVHKILGTFSDESLIAHLDTFYFTEKVENKKLFDTIFKDLAKVIGNFSDYPIKSNKSE